MLDILTIVGVFYETTAVLLCWTAVESKLEALVVEFHLNIIAADLDDLGAHYGLADRDAFAVDVGEGLALA